MRLQHLALLLLVVLIAACSAVPPSAWDEFIVGYRPNYQMQRLAKRWSRLEPSIRFAGSGNSHWFNR